ncbi:MAG TPA: ferritin family protein [Bacillota bacterium]|nr:ferritin family protein [Bacillota bacterium]
MKRPVNIADVAAIALNMEERGQKFYLNLAAGVDDKESREFFLKLAREEEEHRLIFQKILSRYDGGGELDLDSPDFLGAAAAGGVFLPETSPEGVKTLKDAVSLGIQTEKDAILFYHELAARAKSENTRKALYNLLKEEKMHLIELRDYAEELAAKSERKWPFPFR